VGLLTEFFVLEIMLLWLGKILLLMLLLSAHPWHVLLLLLLRGREPFKWNMDIPPWWMEQDLEAKVETSGRIFHRI